MIAMHCFVIINWMFDLCWILLTVKGMFAKLKKKIEEQGGNVAEGEKFNNSGNASTPRKGT